MTKVRRCAAALLAVAKRLNYSPASPNTTCEARLGGRIDACATFAATLVSSVNLKVG